MAMLHRVWNKPVQADGEEVEWWTSLMDRFMDAYHAAEKDGSLGRGGVARRMGISPDTTVVLDEADMKLAREQAAARGITYQQHVQNLVRVGMMALQAEEDAAPAKLAEEDARQPQWLTSHFGPGERVTS